MIFITDIDERRYVDVNPAACEYYGVSKRDLIGRKIDEFLPPVFCSNAGGGLGGVDQQRTDLRRAGRHRSIDGTLQVAEASARPNFLSRFHIAFFRELPRYRKRLQSRSF